MMRRWILALLVLLIGAQTALAENRLDLIEQRGALIVGVKADYPPWGMVDENGNLVGLEADLARNIAERLRVALKLIGVSSSNRLQRVEDGSVDLVIATMGDTVQRRQLAGLIEPNYYASGVNILVPKDLAIDDWSDLRGRPICLSDGAYYNRILIERYLFKPVVFKGNRDAQLGLENGRCVGWAYDDLAISPMLSSERWADYAMPLKSILVSPWAAAVKSDQREGPWGRFVSDVIVEWHSTGFLLEREAAWGLPPSSYLQEQELMWDSEECARRNDGSFPPACLDQELLKASGRAADVYGQGLALTLVEMGIDFPPLYDSFSFERLLEGVGWTLLLSVCAIVGSLGFGMVAGMALANSAKPLRIALDAGLSVFYMTPPILNLYLLLFGVGGWLALHHGLALDAFWVAFAVFSLYAGGSNAVIVAGAIDWVNQQDTSERSWQEVMSLAIVRGYGGLVANSVNIVKAVGIASTIAVPEVIFAAGSIIAEHGTTMEMMNFLMLFYLALISVFVLALDKTKGWMVLWVSRKS